MVFQASCKQSQTIELTIRLEIRELDTDLQNLVYQNYNKFIAASDTVNTMKDHVDEMEKTMADLKKKMRSVVENGKIINGVFVQRQKAISAIKEQIKNGVS